MPRRSRRAPCGTDTAYHRHLRDGEPACNACKRAHADRHAQVLRDNPDILKRRQMKRYGLTLQDRDDFIAKQNGQCAICRCQFSWVEPMRRPCIDHEHTEKAVVRGVLCGRCNLAIGMIGDSLAELRRFTERAEKYLAVHEQFVASCDHGPEFVGPGNRCFACMS